MSSKTQYSAVIHCLAATALCLWFCEISQKAVDIFLLSQQSIYKFPIVSPIIS